MPETLGIAVVWVVFALEDYGAERSLIALTGSIFCYIKTLDSSLGEWKIRTKAMNAEVDYHGYRLRAVRIGSDWTVYIHSPGSRFSFDAMKTTRGSDDRDWVISEAKAFVDTHMRQIKTSWGSRPAY